MVPIKTRSEIETMQQAGHILAGIMQGLSAMIKPGVATADLERASLEAMFRSNATSAFKGYHGYPGGICVSINEEVVHGIPGLRKLSLGDIVSIDIGIIWGGFFVDMAKTFPVGDIDAEKQRLIEVAKAALTQAIKMLKPELDLSEVSEAVQHYVESQGFSVVRDFVGHGIGRMLHEEPQIPNFKTPQIGPILKEGMVLAIEPMINSGTWEIEILKDGWTAVTKDRKPSAHFEHTVAIRDGGCEILTQ